MPLGCHGTRARYYNLTTGLRCSKSLSWPVGRESRYWVVVILGTILILVALAEHIGFTTVYILASSIIVGINSLYCLAILGSLRTSAVVAAVLSATYGMLFVILKAEDYALLGGTMLFHMALMVTMYFTRRLHEPE